MQGCCLSGAGRADHQDQAVGLVDALFQNSGVALGQAEFVVGYRLTAGQNAHDNVLKLPGGRNGGDTQLHVERTELLEVNLSVLGLASF